MLGLPPAQQILQARRQYQHLEAKQGPAAEPAPPGGAPSYAQRQTRLHGAVGDVVVVVDGLHAVAVAVVPTRKPARA